MRNSRAAGGPQSLISLYGRDLINELNERDLSTNPPCTHYDWGHLALPVNHRVGGSLENFILKISSRVINRRLWGKLLSSMIRYRLDVTNVPLYHILKTLTFTW